MGCGEFIDNFGTVDFVHFLSRVFPDFKSFCADANSHLRGMRSDYELPDFIFPNDHLAPVVKPSFFVSDVWIFLLTTRIMIKKSQNTRIYQNALVDEFQSFTRPFCTGHFECEINETFQRKFFFCFTKWFN